MEQEIAGEINAAGVKATSSYIKYPQVKHNQKITEDDIDNLISQFKKDGFSGIVLTVLKDVKLSIIHISEPTRLGLISHAVSWFKK